MQPTTEQTEAKPRQERDQAASKKEKMMLWLKRVGVAGFLFFLIKGILWLYLGKEVIEAIFG